MMIASFPILSPYQWCSLPCPMSIRSSLKSTVISTSVWGPPPNHLFIMWAGMLEFLSHFLISSLLLLIVLNWEFKFDVRDMSPFYYFWSPLFWDSIDWLGGLSVPLFGPVAEVAAAALPAAVDPPLGVDALLFYIFNCFFSSRYSS